LEHLPEESLVVRAIVTQNLGVAYHWSGDPTAASRTLTQAVQLSRAAGQTFQTLTAMAILGRAQEMQGSLRQAFETYKEALELGAEGGNQPVPFAGMAYVGLAGLLYEWDELDEAQGYALEGARLSALGGFVAYQVFGHGLLARIYGAQGRRDEALAALREAERLGQRCDYALVMALVAELRVRLWLSQGNVAAASRWAQARRLGPADELDAAGEIEQTAVVRVQMAQSRLDEALNLLARLLEAARAAGRRGSAVKILALQALAMQAGDDLEGALSTLARALALAEPQRYVRTFVDEGELMAQLLRRAVGQGIAPEYAGRLLSSMGGRAAPLALAEQPLVEPLTERELEVLRLIAAGLSNREIAQELVIAVSTVKSHVNHIYGKLGVKNRTQAVAKAHDLALL
jgi:LuxR family maltose regulon positive regulatory protein